MDPLETTFELNDTLYAKAEVPPTDEVYLWLGANVMLAYPLDEAVSLLGDKLSGAQKSLDNCDEDLDFLREQVTTLEKGTLKSVTASGRVQRPSNSSSLVPFPRESVSQEGLLQGGAL